MKHFFTLLLGLSVSAVYGQSREQNWYFGGNAGLRFNAAPAAPTVLSDGQLFSYEASATMSDAGGNLLMYTNAVTVWDRTHTPMPGGPLVGGYQSASQGALILPAPGSTSQYYLFVVDAAENGFAAGLHYSVVDMTLRNGLGDLTATKNVAVPTPSPQLTEKLTAVRHANGRDYWVLVHGWQNNSFHAYLLSPAGLSATPVTTTIGITHTGGVANGVGYMKASPNGQLLGVAIRDAAFELFDFNNSTGQLSNLRRLYTAFGDRIYGVAFSPDNTKLYTTDLVNGVYQFDLSASTISRQFLGSTPGQSGAVALAPDGRIYVAAYNTSRLSAITNPNGAGGASGFVSQYVTLSGTSQIGLPNFPNAFAVVVNEWTGAVSTTYTDAANWSAGYVPGASDDVTIPATAVRMPVLGAAAAAASFTVASGASMTVAPGGDLTLTRTLTNNGTFSGDGSLRMGASGSTQLLGSGPVRIGSLTVGGSPITIPQNVDVQTPLSITRVLTLGGNLTMSGSGALTLVSDASGTAMVVNQSGVVSGAATVQRYLDPSLNPGLGYRHLAAPVTNTTLSDLATSGFVPAFNLAYNTSAQPGTVTPFPTVYGYDQGRLTTSPATGTSAFDKGWYSPGSSTDAMVAGQGYTVNMAAGQTVDFVGTLGNGSLTVGALGRGPQADAGWQLLGNPYPAPIDFTLLSRSGLDNAVYVYKSSGQYSGAYASYVNGVATNGGSNVLPLGQAFFVRTAAGATGSMSFTNAARLTSYQNPALQRGRESRPLLTLTLTNAAGQRDQAVVYAQAGATAGFDAGFDAYKIAAGGLPALSVPVGGEELAISGLPALGATTQVLPLTVVVPTSGTYALTASELLNLPAGCRVSLLDGQTGISTLLTGQNAYSFSAAAGALIGRFSLLIEPARPTATASALAQQVSVYPNPAHGQLWLALPARYTQQTVRVTVLNALGQAVLTQTLPAGRPAATALTLPTNLAQGVYSVRLQLPDAVVDKRVVLE
ncbi:T9SS type A sorting domain-containing protein [Hymenobacter sp. 15J16-1T3B]|uniref:T9SS type A sorting domain-containing protein n=1 Tax=Hymenobacter sp. 15J16-1T3B TaxID=2886941 RepID=UPI001D112574|nr:T9SS type A sorting domain-containing protein [Hymenobacter sp. 15J16-1T3B]MCC3159406.1 T9SS type A sorting domain-containing protein [Hymenobacter sp. 15J16-1T3B]